MAINRGMDKEDVVHARTRAHTHTHTHNGILLSRKKNERVSFEQHG